MSLARINRVQVLANAKSILMKNVATNSNYNVVALQTITTSMRRASEDPLTIQTRLFFSKVKSSSPASASAHNNGMNAGVPAIKEEKVADHSWRQLNRIWSDEDIKDKMASKDQKHVPRTISDHVASNVMKLLYHGFNGITGYKKENPSPKSIEWRLIILESFAGVPGMLAASYRHFYSLRTLRRDHGSIYTFLEEAENERMHLLVCLKMFEASPTTKAL